MTGPKPYGLHLWRCCNTLIRILSLVILTVVFQSSAFPQVSTYGSASSLGGNCYRLTQALGNQMGAAWNGTPIDLSNPVDLRFTVNLGTNNGGADGIAFVLRDTLLPSFGGTGGGSLGMAPFVNMVGVEFDTYQNGTWGDLAADHSAILSGGSTSHTAATNLAGPVQSSATNANIEDGQDHEVRITWDPVSQDFDVYFDCVFRLNYNGDIINNIFQGDPLVYWGFTGATGGLTNVQSFCVIPYPATFVTTFDDSTICSGNSVQLSISDSTNASYSWTNAASLSSSTIANPVATPATNTTYEVTVNYSCDTILDTVQINVIPGVSINLGNDTTLCQGDSTLLDATFFNATSYLWNSGSTSPTEWASTSGMYYVTVTNPCGPFIDSILVNIDLAFTFDLGPDITLCQGATIQLAPGIPGATYQWQDNSIAPTFNVSSANQYWVNVSNACNAHSDTINISYLAPPGPDLGNDTVLCENNSYTVDVTFPQSNYFWQDGSFASSMLIDQPGTYAVTVTNLCGTANDNVLVGYDSLFTLDLGPDIELCPGPAPILNTSVSVSSANYLWQDGSSNPTFSATLTNTYAVTVSNACATATDSIHVQYLTTPVFNLGPDTTLCTGNTITLGTTYPGSGFSWQDGSTAPQYAATLGGQYWVQISNICGIGTDTIELFQLDPPVIDLGNDTTLCANKHFLLNAAFDQSTYLWQNGSMGSGYASIIGGKHWVEITNFCGVASDTIDIDRLDAPSIDLSIPPILCLGDLRNVNATVPLAERYLWDNGDTLPFRTLNQAATYWVRVSNDCGSDVDSIYLLDLAPPVVELAADINLCRGIPLIIGPDPVNGNLFWQDGVTDRIREINTGGLYWVESQNQCGSDRDSIRIRYFDYPKVQLGNDTAICPRDTILLRAFQHNLLYDWSTGETDGNIRATAGNTYSVTVSNKYGCAVQDAILVDRADCSTLYIPNAFTPNDDRKNSTFKAEGTDIAEFSLRIYNRWGELIFHTNDINQGWDGYSKDFTLAPNGTYIWKIIYRGNEQLEPQELHGRVSLFR